MNAKELEDSKLERAFCAAHGQCDFVRQRAIQKLIDQRDAETQTTNQRETMTKLRIQLDRRSRKTKHWAKIVTGCDRDAKGGYAILGDWVEVGKEEEVEAGAIIAFADDDDVKLYRVDSEGDEHGGNMVEITEDWIDYKSEKYTLCDAIDAALSVEINPLASVSDDDLMLEITRRGLMQPQIS